MSPPGPDTPNGASPQPASRAAGFFAELAKLATTNPTYATRFVERLLTIAQEAGVSDLHLNPAEAGLDVRWRVDGVLQPVGLFPPQVAANIVARLKVLAELLTYRTDVPQEGRIRGAGQVEMRVSTFPTLYGEKAVVRLFGAARSYEQLADLGLPAEIVEQLGRLLNETSGAILITGPAGSGKTTTAYACVREVLARSNGARSIASLEDPIEVAIPGIAQSQVNPAAEFDLATALRFLLRQDPEVILVGEIRDQATAEVAFQAALTGHLILSTFHAGSAAGAVSRLSDMGIAPYLLRSGVLAIVSQRLVRKLCDCSQPVLEPALLGMPITRARRPVGCERCGGSGYQGRMLLAEMLTPEASEIGRAMLSREDSARIEQLAVSAGMTTRWQRAFEAIESGATSPEEVRRVLGFSPAGLTGLTES